MAKSEGGSLYGGALVIATLLGGIGLLMYVGNCSCQNQDVTPGQCADICERAGKVYGRLTKAEGCVCDADLDE